MSDCDYIMSSMYRIWPKQPKSHRHCPSMGFSLQVLFLVSLHGDKLAIYINYTVKKKVIRGVDHTSGV